MAGRAETVASVIDGLGLTDVILVGQDSGGMIARYAAEKRPEVVRALALCGTEIPGIHPPLISLFSTLAKLPGAKALFQFSMGNKFVARIPLILGGSVTAATSTIAGVRRLPKLLGPRPSDRPR